VLFKTMPKDIRNILLTEPVTANHHRYVLIVNYFNIMNNAPRKQYALNISCIGHE